MQSYPPSEPAQLDLLHPTNPEAVWDYRDLGLLLAFMAGVFLLLQLLAAGGVALWSVLAGGDLGEEQLGELVMSAPFALGMQSALWAAAFVFLGFSARVRHSERLLPALSWRPFHAPLWRFSLLGVGLVAAVGIASRFISLPEGDLPIEELMRDRGSLILTAFFGVLVAPVAEELFFRGFLYNLLENRHGTIAALLVTSAPFALLHITTYGAHWQYPVVLFGVGLALGVVRWRTGSVQPPTIVHAVFNGAQFLPLLFLTQEQLEEVLGAVI